MTSLAFRRRSSGLTLIELAITLAVLAILGAITLPGFGAALERQRLRTAAQTLSGDLAEARFEAARRGQPLYWQASSGADWCWALSASSGCGCGAPQACQIHRVAAADHPGVQLSTAATGVTLQASGLAQADAGDGAVVGRFASRSGERLRVELRAAGRPRICAEAGTWPRVPAC